jgi:hypothetical protein
MKPTLPRPDASASGANYDTEFLSRHSTKVLIQDAATRRYLADNGLWLTAPEQALAFRSGSAAMEHLTQRKLTNVRLVLNRAITVSEVIPVTDLLRA